MLFFLLLSITKIAPRFEMLSPRQLCLNNVVEKLNIYRRN